MDGDVFAVKAESGVTGGDLAGVINGHYRLSGDSVSVPKVFRPEMEGAAPIAHLLLRTITVLAAILGTCGAAWLGRLFLTPTQMVDQLLPDVIALLVFFLAVRLR